MKTCESCAKQDTCAMSRSRDDFCLAWVGGEQLELIPKNQEENTVVRIRRLMEASRR